MNTPITDRVLAMGKPHVMAAQLAALEIEYARLREESHRALRRLKHPDPDWARSAAQEVLERALGISA